LRSRRFGEWLCSRHMKRLVWLLLAVLCTAWVQVQPAVVPAAAAKDCRGCCPCCGCGTPGCCPAPVSATAAPVCAQIATLAPARARKALPSRGAAVRVLAPISEAAARCPACSAAAEAARVAGVPLFKAHCSFLI
jgi:hypothetical protein